MCGDVSRVRFQRCSLNVLLGLVPTKDHINEVGLRELLSTVSGAGVLSGALVGFLGVTFTVRALSGLSCAYASLPGRLAACFGEAFPTHITPLRRSACVTTTRAHFLSFAFSPVFVGRWHNGCINVGPV